MRHLTQAAAAATVAAVLFAGCGGGGSSSPTPSQAGVAPAVHATAAPAASRTAVGTATLTLSLPHVLVGKNGKAVRVAPSGSGRRPKYVNPVAGGGVCSGNVLDIYVDGSLVPALDGGPEAPDSLCVNPASSDGTQTANVPLFSTGSNLIVAVEWDPTISNVLAIGEYNGGQFSPGSGQTLTLTMQMNVYWIGITDLAFNNPQLMQGGTYSFCAPQVGVYSADWEGAFVPVAGYGGTSTPTVTGTSDNAGTSKFAQTTIPGIYSAIFDGSYDGITLNATAANPAYAIYNDVASANYSNYYYGYSSNYTAGPNQGIFNLYFTNTNGFQNWFAQLNFPAETASVDLQSGC